MDDAITAVAEVPDDRFVDPIKEGFDTTVRVGEPQPLTSPVGREIVPVKRVLSTLRVFKDGGRKIARRHPAPTPAKPVVR